MYSLLKYRLTYFVPTSLYTFVEGIVYRNSCFSTLDTHRANIVNFSQDSCKHQAKISLRCSGLDMKNQCSVSGTFCYGSGCGPGSSDPYLWLTDPDADPEPYQNLQWLLRCKKIYFFILLNVFINKFKSFKIVQICLMNKSKFLARKLW